MAFKKPNRVRMSITGTPGTGDVALNVATSGYQTFANGGVANNDTFPYVIEDGANWEVGVGTYHSGGPSFTRTTVRASSGGGTSKISASSSAVVYSSILGEDVPTPVTALAGLTTDVTLTSPADGDVLTYVAADSAWENLPASGGGGGGGPGGTMTPPVIASLTAETNASGMTLTQRTTGVLIPSLHVVPVGAVDANIYCIEQAPPGGSWSAVCKVRPLVVSDNADGYHGAGIVFRDSLHGYLMCFCVTAGTQPKVYYDFATGGPGTFTCGAPSSAETISDTDMFLHLDWNNSAATFNMGVSRNGVDKVNYFSFTAGYMATNPTYVGICWLGDYASSAGGGQSGPEYDFQHWHVGASGTNGL